MRHLFQFAVAILILTALSPFCVAQDRREEKPRFKGVELYSWKNGNGWVFVLLDGTNEEKTAAEVKAAKARIKSAEDLQKAIGRLAVGEQVSWVHRVEGFEFPPDATRKKIQEAAEKAKVILRISIEK